MLPIIFEINEYSGDPFSSFCNPPFGPHPSTLKQYIPQLSTTAATAKIWMGTTGRTVSLHLHHPLFLFYLWTVNSCPSLQTQPDLFSLFSHTCWHAMRFYFDSMLYIWWAICLSWLCVCVYIYLSNSTPCVVCPRGSSPPDMRRLI